MARVGRQRNEKLFTLIKTCQWSYEACAAAVRAVARENNDDDLRSCDRSHVGHWIAGVQPSGLTPQYIAEAVSRRLDRAIRPADLGFRGDASLNLDVDGLDWWRRDAATDLLAVGRADLDRRGFALQALYSLAALAVPVETWQEIANRGWRAHGGGMAVGQGEVTAVREMFAMFSRADEQFGGGHARLAIVQYLTTDVAGYLHGRFAGESDRRAMFSAASQVAWLAGWKSFDSSEHGLAQRYFLQAVRLANEADDRALASFTLRAMAHQAVDLGHGQQALDLADSALRWSRGRATPAATALFMTLTARGHAAVGDRKRTIAAISKAESLISSADPATEPMWIQTTQFTEAALAHEIGRALQDLRDLGESERQFRRSVTTRNQTAKRRTHALTIAYLAEVQCAQGRLQDATRNWNSALDSLSGVTSGRIRGAVKNILTRLTSLGPRLPAFAQQLDQRASAYLRGEELTAES
jgi:tetratricopeptide (TPR) repeat protein